MMDWKQVKNTLVEVDASKAMGPLECWRHGLGHNAVTRAPLPDKVMEGLQKLKPRLLRVFLVEYFNVLPELGVYDWSLLDPYMEAVAATGADIMATINLKPPALYPVIDHTVWRPADTEAYQELIRRLVHRYSVEKPYVTHWKFANETDMGEFGGCPFRIERPEENFAFYRMMVQPILEAYPEAKVGGPALANPYSPIMEGFVHLCYETGTPLDFVTWHCYDEDPAQHTAHLNHVRQVLSIYGDNRPEMMLNEMNSIYDFADLFAPTHGTVFTEDMAMAPRRACFIAANIITLLGTNMAGSNYFCIYDDYMRPSEYTTYFSASGARQVMYKHWNELPARWGLFAENETVRPPYFVYRMLRDMGATKLHTVSDDEDLYLLAGRQGDTVSLMAVNYGLPTSKPQNITLRFEGLTPSLKRLSIYRIDEQHRWDEKTLELIPVEQRRVDVLSEFVCQFYCPADAVVLAVLEPWTNSGDSLKNNVGIQNSDKTTNVVIKELRGE